MHFPRELQTVPNAISGLRALAGPVVMVLIVWEDEPALITALAVMIVAEISDIADGLVARQFEQDTELGGLIDPVCDSIYHLSIFLGLLASGLIPVWVLFAIFSRDLMVPYLTTFAWQHGQTLKVRMSNGLKSGLHGACQIGIVALAAGFGGDLLPVDQSIQVLAIVVSAVSVLSLLDHGVEALRITAK